jgi:hypothetical protein
MAPHNKTHRKTQLELFEPEQLYFVTWETKDGKIKQTKHAVNMECCLTFIRVLGYDRNTKNPLIKKAPTNAADAY